MSMADMHIEILEQVRDLRQDFEEFRRRLEIPVISEGGTGAPSPHGMTSTHHTHAGGAALDVFGLSAPSTLAVLTPSSNPGATGRILRTADTTGYVQIRSVGVGAAPWAANVVAMANGGIIGCDNTSPQITFDNTGDELELRVTGGSWTFRGNSSSPNLLGGYSGNTLGLMDSYGNVIAGGGEAGNINQIGNTVLCSNISGGRGNSITYSGPTGSICCSITGGHQCSITSVSYSTAGGNRAKISHSGVFLWADSTAADFTSLATNEFAIRARGGFRHAYSSTVYYKITVSSAGAVVLDAVGTGPYFSFSDNVLIGTTTDGMTAAGSLAIAQDLAHRGTKAGFFNKAPTTKPTALTAAVTTITHTAPGTPDYAIQDFVDVSLGAGWAFADHDEANSVLQALANAQTRLGELETKFQALGLLA